MKQKTAFLFLLIAIALTGSQCKKENSEIDKLPPATQSGAKTFGCLVNGKAWIPDNGCTLLCPSALKFYYDNTNGGQFAIQAELKLININEKIIIGIDSCKKTGMYSYYKSYDNPIRFAYYNYNKPTCLFSTVSDSTVIASGNLNIEKFDLTNGIISGTFEFSLSKQGCQTVHITNGRFDAKL